MQQPWGMADRIRARPGGLRPTQLAGLPSYRTVTVMIWAPLWGYLIFAETPRLTTLAGMAFILAAGLYGAGVPARVQPLATPAPETP